jgi:predicted amidohydrolase YtcJ
MERAMTGDGPADLVLLGEVYTLDPARPWAEALAVRDGQIAAVGPADEVRELAGSGTRKIDLPGRLILPGFQDSHVHPPHAGLERIRCDLNDVRGADEYASRIREYGASHPDEHWILGGGWALDHFPGGTPHRQLLDELVPDRPVFLVNRDGHGAWVNSRALQLAGIDGLTPDPADGRIERDPGGEPAGMLHEGAMALMERVVPPTTAEQTERALLLAQEHLHSLGITAWQDAWVHEDTLGAYRTLADDGRLTARVVAALWWERDRGEEQIDELLERRSAATRGRLRATSVKIMQDGIVENFTAALLEPYLRDGGSTPGSGLSFIEPGALNRSVARLDAEGFQVHVHAIGDRAVREALDAFQAARGANGPNDHRHHIAHLQVVHPDDVPRFGALGVVANCQPYWACLDSQMRELNVEVLGPDRVAHQYPFASLKRSGARLAFGSDWSVSTANPLHEMQVAVTRVPFDEPEIEPFLPHERLDLPTAIEAFTLGSAFVNHLDDVTGTLSVGKYADIAVLDRNPLASDPARVGEARVLLTLVEGQPVFADPAVSW